MSTHLARLIHAAWFAVALQASAQELPRSPACRTALQALNDAEDALADSAAASAPSLPDQQRLSLAAARLQPLRQRVAQACLGGLTTSPSPAQRTWVAPAAPAAAGPPAVTLPRVPQPGMPALTLPRVEAPVTVNHCNAATCVASDGSTLTRVGPTLVGPRGACRQDGVFLRCP